MKTILALDLGTKTGYCYGCDLRNQQRGTWNLATAKEVRDWGKERLTRRCDPRVARLWHELDSLPRPDIVVFEDVEFASYTKQVQLWASLRAAVWLSYGGFSGCGFSGVLVECVPVATLKKFATGAGNANKNGMERAATRLGINVKGLDDNAIDALHLWRWAERNLSRWQDKTTTTKTKI